MANALDFLIRDYSELTSILVTEGKKTKVYSTRYERSTKNRQAAILIHGLNCKVCGFNFEKKYGTLGYKFIEIHHKNPLYLNNTEINIDPRNDLVPLCSNCHRMIHRNGRLQELTEHCKLLKDLS
ncbi:MAG: HNH endonuclease [Streptococcus salivarius]|nr:HNH endonuclease [Streptococcus salivarius]